MNNARTTPVVASRQSSPPPANAIVRSNRGRFRFSYEQPGNNANQEIADDRHYHLGKRECFREAVPVGVRNVSDDGGEDSGRENETNFPAETTDPRLSE